MTGGSSRQTRLKAMQFYFPRSQSWFDDNRETAVKSDTIFFAGSKRVEKSFKTFVEFARQSNLVPIANQGYSNRLDYISDLFSCEYLWCGYGQAFSQKPSNTLLDGICAKRKIVVSKNVSIQLNGFLPGKKSPSVVDGFDIYKPRGQRLLKKNNDLFFDWLRMAINIS